jgi:hypothetical protein
MTNIYSSKPRVLMHATSKTHQAKSQVFTHCAFVHLFFVQGSPYVKELNFEYVKTAMIIRMAAICNRIFGRRVDVARSKTAQLSRIAKYSAGK